MTKQSGFTLIELMVGLLVGFIVIAAAFAMYSTSLVYSTTAIKAARLHHELQTIMDVMVMDIRRAAYWGGGGGGGGNPFTSAATDLDANTPSCIVYTYDRDSDGLGPVNAEYVGFKLESGEVKMRDGTNNGLKSCAVGTWEGISDGATVVVDQLRFSTAGSKCKVAASANTACTGYVASTRTTPTAPGDYVETRQIDIRLAGHLVGDPSVSKVLQATVKVRNDRLFAVSP